MNLVPQRVPSNSPVHVFMFRVGGMTGKSYVYESMSEEACFVWQAAQTGIIHVSDYPKGKASQLASKAFQRYGIVLLPCKHEGRITQYIVITEVQLLRLDVLQRQTLWNGGGQLDD